MNEITTGNPNYRGKDQIDTIKYIKDIFKSREKKLRKKCIIK